MRMCQWDWPCWRNQWVLSICYGHHARLRCLSIFWLTKRSMLVGLGLAAFISMIRTGEHVECLCSAKMHLIFVRLGKNSCLYYESLLFSCTSDAATSSSATRLRAKMADWIMILYWPTCRACGLLPCVAQNISELGFVLSYSWSAKQDMNLSLCSRQESQNYESCLLLVR